MRLFSIILGYIGLHLLWGRKASFPYAVGFNFKWYFIFLSGYLMDLLVLLLLFWAYERTFSLRFLSLAKEKVLSFEERISKSKMISWARPMGKASLFLMPAIPTAGRPFNILFLTRIFKLKYKESFFLFALGNLIGTVIYILTALIAKGIITGEEILALLHH